jgi:hypothetical protein
MDTVTRAARAWLDLLVCHQQEGGLIAKRPSPVKIMSALLR